jgi:hypothetical protein
LTNFGQHKGMPLMSTTMVPILVNIETKVWNFINDPNDLCWLALGVDMDWSIISTNPWAQKKPNFLWKIPWSIKIHANFLTSDLSKPFGFQQPLEVANLFSISLDQVPIMMKQIFWSRFL